VAEISIRPEDTTKRGKGVWKLNKDLLKDQAFQREIRAFHTFWSAKKPDCQNIHEWWDAAKCQYKQIAIQHAVRKSRNRHAHEAYLVNKLTELKHAPRPDRGKIQQLEHELQTTTENRIAGCKIRSRAAWIEDGEKPTRYFFELERKKQTAARITELQTRNGLARSDKDILAVAHAFYQELYTNEPVDTATQDKLLAQLDNRLDEHAKRTCEGPVTRPELDASIKKMHVNKSPGPDGLTTEFYQTFWTELADDLCAVYNYAHEQEQLPDTQATSILRLLFKKGERQHLKNWRPIALLNTDYKLLATTIANRLKPTLSQVIGEQQTCGIPGRTIFDTTMALRDIVHDVKTRRANGILISLDQEKAFDRVNRPFLEKIMRKLNYGPSFLGWIRTLYAGANCKIINNGHLSDPVFLHRGVRQGCPLSPLLYVLAIETLIVALKRNPRIHGITIPGTSESHKLAAYADDVTLTLTDDTSVVHAFDTIQAYERATGSKLNPTKTEGLYLGRQAGRTTGPVPITWNTAAITILGGKYGNTDHQDWEKPVSKLEQTLTRWQKRHLTLKGKTVLIKTYGLASITYLATTFPLPDQIATKIHKLLFRFLWNDRNELVSRATCHLPLSAGGLGIPDLYSSARAVTVKWMKNLTDPRQHSVWLHYGRYWTGLFLGPFKPEWSWLRSNTSPHGDPNHIPSWYSAILFFAQAHRANLILADHQHLTAKTFTTWQRDYQEPRCVREWKRTVRPPLDMEGKWKYLWNSAADNQTKEIMWKAMHRVLPTKSYLSSWGMQIDLGCPYCKRREDLHHALLGCERAGRLWQQLEPLLEQVAGRRIPILLDTIILGNDLPTNGEAKALSFYLITLAASILWKTRGRKTWNKEYQGGDLYHQCLGAIRKRIQHEKRTNKSRLLYMWNYKDILCSYRRGTFEIHV
jgi:hypothetical protein